MWRSSPSVWHIVSGQSIRARCQCIAPTELIGVSIASIGTRPLTSTTSISPMITIPPLLVRLPLLLLLFHPVRSCSSRLVGPLQLSASFQQHSENQVRYERRMGLTFFTTRSNALLVSLLAGKVDGSKYCGAYSMSHSGRTSVTVRMNYSVSSRSTHRGGNVNSHLR